MIDPMADIDQASPAGPDMDGGVGADGNLEVFDANAYRSNLAKMDKIRSFMGIAAGCVAGVCGLTGLGGLGEFRFRSILFFYFFRRRRYPTPPHLSHAAPSKLRRMECKTPM
jgi:hypothetical protein